MARTVFEIGSAMSAKNTAQPMGSYRPVQANPRLAGESVYLTESTIATQVFGSLGADTKNLGIDADFPCQRTIRSFPLLISHASGKTICPQTNTLELQPKWQCLVAAAVLGLLYKITGSNPHAWRRG